MDKELDYFDIAGILQAKSYQFNALGLNAMNNYIYSSEEQALKYIENLISDFERYKDILKKKIAERNEQKQTREARLREKYEYEPY